VRTETIPIEEISVSPQNVRRDYQFGNVFSDLSDEDKALVRSIHEHGVLQPIIVRRVEPQGYECVIGQRRLLAARLAKIKKVVAIVQDWDDEESLYASLSENIHRKDIDPIARAKVIRELVDMSGSLKAVARRLGIPKSTLSEWLRVLDLCEEVQSMVSDGDLSFRAAVKLAQKNLLPAEQCHLAKIGRNSLKDCYKELRKRKRDSVTGEPITTEEVTKETVVTPETAPTPEKPEAPTEEAKVPLPETPVEIRFKIPFGEYKELMRLAEANGFGTETASVNNFVRQIVLDYIKVVNEEAQQSGETEASEEAEAEEASA